MPDYEVKWTMDVTAGNAREALECGVTIQEARSTLVFEVKDRATGEITLFDLTAQAD